MATSSSDNVQSFEKKALGSGLDPSCVWCRGLWETQNHLFMTCGSLRKLVFKY
jgi:hypothetical protein